MKQSYINHIIAALLGVGFNADLFAQTNDFVLDPAQSRITMSGMIDYRPTIGGVTGHIPFEEQETGSLETGYTGILHADVTESTITFPGSSAIVAQDSGVWRPGVNGSGSATNANYGAHASELLLTMDLALRHLMLDPTSATLALTNGTFEAGAVSIEIPTNATSQADVSFSVGSAMGIPMAGATFSNQTQVVGTLTEMGEVQTLTLPVDVVVEGPYWSTYVTGTMNIHLAGLLVASRTNPVPFRIRSIRSTAHTVTLEWEATPGQSYGVQQTTDFSHWTAVASNLTTPSNSLSWSTSRVQQVEFFRLSK